LPNQVLLDHVSCIAMPGLLNIQSSSTGLNNISTSEVATNPLVFQKLQLNLQKYIKLCCNFNKISIPKKKLCCKKILT